MSPPEVLGSSTSPCSDDATTCSSTDRLCESQFVRNFIKDFLCKHCSCTHFLDTPVSFTGDSPLIFEDKYAVTVKQLHLDIPLQLLMCSSSTLEDVIDAYESEMDRLGQTPIPTGEQRWLHKGKPLLNTAMPLACLSTSKEITLHLVRKVSTIPSKSEIDLFQALCSFERDANSGHGHTCTDPQCKSSVSFLLSHLKE
ncbi:hypothetical protein MDAP_001824 [Mitosporidium daphniae]|uniref:Ubiquitin-like domain-containing protein n=1 Tax=Mitosporidium daphniae TaxID=1485682 RepID=A0A098VU85_9MICR|nr:uncharacterized protein DI09_42p230 [Mitosporidium daphniae]XP_013239129.1 uncharacterized protein DI09_142p60 [Mitosporidium daphniae]KGG51180.1 hypothetical protein DI09_42p230 [Mitosporidium daphniae]KGG52693.1 hypothetical protein DI09_142p60 [Mitosporidium daphniae]|eukprot:XP_013237607.1 uncharacterized protein DI09_42p230 [Mitosporidium daphniae]